MARNTLTSKSWIEAAFRSLTVGGPQAIRAEAIARDLNVSKGSFYWHFENVETLKKQMLALWREQATEGIISALEGTQASAPDKLRGLVEIATGNLNIPYGGVMAEAAIRDWGRYDANAAETVKAVDRQRLEYLDMLFAQSGAKKDKIRMNSVILYGALIGLESLAHTGSAQLPNDLKCLLETLLDAL